MQEVQMRSVFWVTLPWCWGYSVNCGCGRRHHERWWIAGGLILKHVNIFHFKFMIFHLTKGVNSVPPILLYTPLQKL